MRKNSKTKKDVVLALKNNDFDLYLECIEHILPKKLYRYCPYNINNVDLIINKNIKLSNPNDYNDPYDSLINKVNGRSLDEKFFTALAIQKIIQNSADPKVMELRNSLIENGLLSDTIQSFKKIQFINRKIEEIINTCSDIESIELLKVRPIYSNFFGVSNPYIGDFVSNSAICCFSENTNDTIMWAHYGKFCSGLCTEYRTDQIISDIKNSQYFFVPVIYDETIYQDYYRQISFDNLTVLWNLPQFMFKHKKWEYENEWRLIRLNTQQSIYKYDYLSSIFLGANFINSNQYSGDNENELIKKYIELLDFSRNENVIIKRLRLKHNEYGFDEY